MNANIMDISVLPEMLSRLFPSGKVRVYEDGGAVTFMPVPQRPLEYTDDEIDGIIQASLDDFAAGRYRTVDESYKAFKRKYDL